MQGIRDMLTQRQSQYAWEAYLKHRKDNLTSSVGTPAALRRDPLKAKEQPSAGEKANPTSASLRSGEPWGVGHNKCCTDKGN